MAQIVISEISQNYSYNIGNNSYATVALPITSSWGPGYFDTHAYELPEDSDMLEQTVWQRFPATQAGLESFVSTYRGPATNYRLNKDFSYQMAMTLLSAGYDVLTCRVNPGGAAQGELEGKAPSTTDPDPVYTGKLTIKAKYPGSFGNNIRVEVKKMQQGPAGSAKYYWNMIVYVVSESGTSTAVENKVFVFELQNATDNILYWEEIESQFVTIQVIDTLQDTADQMLDSTVRLQNGSDTAAPSDYSIVTIPGSGRPDSMPQADIDLYAAILAAAERYQFPIAEYLNNTESYSGPVPAYIDALIDLMSWSPRNGTWNSLSHQPISDAKATSIKFMEWTYTSACKIYSLLTDKLTYNPNRVISPGWDDQDIWSLTDNQSMSVSEISPLHKVLMTTAYQSRCATAYIDIPKSMLRKDVYNDDPDNPGYAQKLARLTVPSNDGLFSTHSALFAPWGQYMYVGTNRQNPASPSFEALMIQRSQILNQATQYEWALPTNRKHNVKLGKLDYNVSKHYLDAWQKLEGVGVNAITKIPDIGLNIWGNSTLFEVPPATYQALANLSTRLLVNAVEDVAYRCGLSITFQYNNEQAYNKFYAGCTPILDTMRNVGAIEDYYVTMGADIDGQDHVNANTVIGKIYLVVRGVIQDIYIDLVALPAGTDLSQYMA